MKTTLESANSSIGWPVDFMTGLHRLLGNYMAQDYSQRTMFRFQNELQKLIKTYKDWELLEDPQVNRVKVIGAEVLADETAFEFVDDEPSWFRFTDVNRQEFFIKVTP